MSQPPSDIADDVIDWVERLHAAVDECAQPVVRANAKRLVCGPGCADCCEDDLTVFEIEAAVIRRHHAELLASGTPHPPGACAFLDADGRCRIYAQRPYVCRTQGLPLRWIVEDDEDPGGEPALIEHRDICPKNANGEPPLEELAADECWTLGPFEARLAERQAGLGGGRPARTPLRALFARQGDPEAPPATDRRRLPVIG